MLIRCPPLQNPVSRPPPGRPADCVDGSVDHFGEILPRKPDRSWHTAVAQNYVSKSSEAGRPLDEVDHVGCGVYRERMMGKARPRRDVTGHFAREFELLVRCRSEQRNQQIL